MLKIRFRYLLLPFMIFCSFMFSGKKRKIVFGPPGTILVRDTIFMDQFEITNEDYKEYINWLKEKYGNEEPYIIKKNLPDTNVWRDPLNYNEALVGLYFSHPAYRNYPVVGVSYRQAMDYCRWRTDWAMAYCMKEAKSDKKKLLPANIESFYYRLPTVHEWEFAAYGGLDSTLNPFGYPYLDDTVHIDKVWVKKQYDDKIGMNSSDETMPVNYALPNPYGFYCMIGNLAEMTSEKGVSKGGSWRDYLDQCHVRDSITFAAPSSWLGFRCVCVVKYKSGYDAVSGKKLSKK